MSAFHKKLAKTDTYPAYIKIPILTCSSWLFQGILYMDTTERVFKILLDFLFFFPIFFVFMSYSKAPLSIFLAIILVHTLNWIFNSQIFALLKLLRLTKTKPELFTQYLTDFKKRVKREESILAAAAFGSLSREELKETSDLDIRIIRKKGFINGFRACLFVMLERSRAFFNKFPLDIYVIDTTKHLSKLRADEMPVVLYDPEEIVEKLYTV